MSARSRFGAADYLLVGAAAIASFVFLLKFTRSPLEFLGWKGFAGLAICSAAWLALALPRAVRLRVALLLGCTSLPLFGVEIGLRYVEPRRNLIPALLSGAPYDRRSVLEFAREERASLPDLSPRLAPTWISSLRLSHGGSRIVTLGNVPHARVVDCNELGSYSVGRMDRYGFRNPDALWDDLRRPAIAVVGDSFTFGSCVGDGQDFVSIVRRKVPATFNFGQGGNGPLLELATLVEYVLPLRPDVVIWQFFEENDLDNLASEIADPLLASYLRQDFSQHLIERRDEVALFLENTAQRILDGESLEPERSSGRYSPLSVLSLYRIRQFVGASITPRKPPGADDERLETLSRILSRARDAVESTGGRFLVLYIPSWATVRRGADPGFGRNRIFEICDRLELEVLDLEPRFRAAPDPLGYYPFRRRSHWNPAGNEFVARAILEHLEARSQRGSPRRIPVGGPRAAHGRPRSIVRESAVRRAGATS